MGSNPTLANAILGLKTNFLYLKTQKSVFICPTVMPKAQKSQKQKINSEPFRTTVLGTIHKLRLQVGRGGWLKKIKRSSSKTNKKKDFKINHVCLKIILS